MPVLKLATTATATYNDVIYVTSHYQRASEFRPTASGNLWNSVPTA
jgi:hypothetical protein